jgi:hypothetical protein
LRFPSIFAVGAALRGAFVGEMDKAKATRQDFFALEINANPGIPILKEAKAECAKL